MRLHWHVLFLCLLLSGCVLPGARNMHDGTPQLPPSQALSADQVPLEVKVVAAMLTNKLRGTIAQPPAEIAFAPQGTHTVQESGFQYQGFAYLGMDIFKFGAQKKADDKAVAGIAGMLRFADQLGRSANAVFVAQYEITPKTLTILSSDIKPVSSPLPQMLCFFVPMEVYSRASGGLTSFAAWLQFIHKNAVNLMTPTAEERARRAQWTGLPEQEKKALAEKYYPVRRYAVLTFSMDRILSPSTLSMGLTSGKDAPLIHPERARFQDYNGWQVGIFEGEFALDHPENKEYIRVDYTPEASIRPRGAPNTYPVGLFAMQKNHSQ